MFFRVSEYKLWGQISNLVVIKGDEFFRFRYLNGHMFFPSIYVSQEDITRWLIPPYLPLARNYPEKLKYVAYSSQEIHICQ